MELAGGPRLDEEGGARLAGAEAQTTTWWTPFLSRQLLHLQHICKSSQTTAQQTDGWTETPANEEASRISITTRKPRPTL